MLTILVSGATGQQGGAVLKALLAADRGDIKIRAITRNPSSQAATSLRSKGVDVVKADLEDGDSLEAALRGCDAAYLVTDFRGANDVSGELEQGKNFVDAALRASISHIVFSSVSGCEDEEVEHFHSKYKIEQIIRRSKLPWTIFRPTGFMDLIPPAGVGRSFFLGAMQAVFGDVKQKWIACDDIGNAVAKALLNKADFLSKVHELVGDEVTVKEVRDALDRGENRQGSWIIWLPRLLVVFSSPYHYRQMFIWLAKGVQPGTESATKAILPQVMNVEAWARSRWVSPPH